MIHHRFSLFTLRVWFLAAALCLGCSIGAPSARAAAGKFWGGGTGQWDTTTAHWGTSSSGPFTSTFGATGENALFTSAVTAGTVTLGMNLSLRSVQFTSGGYTLALAGKTLTATNSLSIQGVTTFNFGLTTSQVTFGATSTTWTGGLTITNFVAGESVLRFGTSSSGLSSADLALITFDGYTNGGAAQIDSNGYVTPTGVSAVPEPSTYAALAGLGALGAALYRRRRPAGGSVHRRSACTGSVVTLDWGSGRAGRR